ncbi:MAG: A/G-specific adenine glycosylase [archaeon]|nr:A/G-specific adenine glycosylase [archaeon]
MQHLSEADKVTLLSWYAENQRTLPWRATRDPWHILLSEILLQQTQMSRGLEYWMSIIERFPTIVDLASADIEDLLMLWQGAGYYARARRLHECAKKIVKEYGGVIPSTFDELLSLPGIGPYTAAAVASIAFGLTHACVDGNIRRVMARLCSIEEPTEKEISMWAEHQIINTPPGDWNQALMELGAMICRPQNPVCGYCPLSANCRGKQNPMHYPRPKKRTSKHVKLTAILEIDNDGFARLYPRPAQGLFGGLYGPTLLEGNIDVVGADFAGVVYHSLSHRDFEISVFIKKTATSGQPISAHPLSSMDMKILAQGGVFE